MDQLSDINLENYGYCLRLVDKLLHDTVNQEQIYDHLCFFIVENMDLVLEYIIVNDLILVAKFFLELLTLNDKHLLMAKSPEMYDLILKCTDTDNMIFKYIKEDNFEAFLTELINVSRDVVTYTELAKSAVINQRHEMLEVILTTIVLEPKTIIELYTITDNELIKNILCRVDPEIVLQQEQTTLKKIESDFEDTEKEQYFQSIINYDIDQFEKYYATRAMFDFRKDAIKLAYIYKNDYAKDKLREVYQDLTNEFYDSSERQTFHFKYSNIEDHNLNLLNYYESIKTKDNKTFDKLWNNISLFDYQQRAISIAEKYHNNYALQKLRNIYNNKMITSYFEKLFQESYDNNNIAAMKLCISKCSNDFLYRYKLKSIDDHRTDVTDILKNIDILAMN